MPFSDDGCLFFQNSLFRFVPLLKFTPMQFPFLLIDALSLQLSFLYLPFSSNSLPCDALFYWLMSFPQNSIFSNCSFLEILSHAMPFSNDWCLFFKILFFDLFPCKNSLPCDTLSYWLMPFPYNYLFSICPFLQIPSRAMPFFTDWCLFLKFLFSQFVLFLKFPPILCPFLMTDTLFLKFSFLNFSFSWNSIPRDFLF